MTVGTPPEGGLNPPKPPTSGKRRWAPRTKTGCITCRIRRVKCDEEKPNCRRCTSTGRKCDGYEQPRPRSLDVQLSPYSSAVPVRILGGDDEENSYFQFFQTTTILHFAGYLDASFWTRRVLQASHVYPALWHAITALGAMHRRFIVDSVASLPLTVADKQMKFALRQFNSSIHHLLKTWPSQMPDQLDRSVVLTASILFTCLCSLQGQHSQAIIHIRNALELFRGSGSLKSEVQLYDSPIFVDIMSLILTRLDTQARTLPDDHSLYVWAKQPTDFTRLKDKFECLIQAYADLEILFNGLFQLIQGEEFASADAVTAFVEERHIYWYHFAAWDTKFADYLATCTENNWKEALPLLKVRRLFASVLLNFDPMKGELAWDEFEDTLVRIVGLASRLLETCENAIRCEFGGPGDPAQSSRPAPSPVRPHFSLTAGIIELLYTIVLRCREPVIRRRALRLLKGRPRREGIWESTFAASIAEAGMIKEESSWQDDARCCLCVEGVTICEDHRVRTVKVILREERRARVSMKTVEECRLSRPGTEILLTW